LDEQIGDVFAKVQRLGNTAINALPADKIAEVAPYQAQLNNAIRLAKNGNTEELTKMIENNADFNRKR